MSRQFPARCKTADDRPVIIGAGSEDISGTASCSVLSPMGAVDESVGSYLRMPSVAATPYPAKWASLPRVSHQHRPKLFDGFCDSVLRPVIRVAKSDALPYGHPAPAMRRRNSAPMFGPVEGCYPARDRVLARVDQAALHRLLKAGWVAWPGTGMKRDDDRG